MNQSSSGLVHLKVHLRGAIAYVPDGDTLWALMPNALLPAPARWRQPKATNIFHARAPHMGLLMVARDLIVDPQTTSPFSMVFESYKNGGSFPPTAVLPLVGSGLDFVLPEGSLQQDKLIDDHFPKLAKISRSHSKVARRFNPGDPEFNWKGLSSAFQLRTGTLTVEGYFGDPDSPKPLDFGYVASNRTAAPFYSRVKYEKIANKLLWEVALPAGQRSVTINQRGWDPNRDDDDYALVLQAPEDRNEIEITIAHTEVEVPVLFLVDPYIPADVMSLPDPDFEMFYGLSSNSNRRSRWRVPIPENVEPSGGIEKPCVGGLFAGFEE